MNDKYDYIVKIVLTGSASVGKSNILSRFTRNCFNLESKPTIGVEFASRDVVVDNKIIRVQLWDTAGQERYKSMTQAFYRNALGAFLIYEVTRRDSFEEISKWLKECKTYASPYAKVCLIGNKNDLTNIREVSYLQGITFANENGLLFCECSALTGEGIEKALQLLIQEIYEQMQRQDIILDNPLNKERNSISLKSSGIKDKKKPWCCFQTQ